MRNTSRGWPPATTDPNLPWVHPCPQKIAPVEIEQAPYDDVRHLRPERHQSARGTQGSKSRSPRQISPRPQARDPSCRRVEGSAAPPDAPHWSTDPRLRATGQAVLRYYVGSAW